MPKQSSCSQAQPFNWAPTWVVGEAVQVSKHQTKPKERGTLKPHVHTTHTVSHHQFRVIRDNLLAEERNSFPEASDHETFLDKWDRVTNSNTIISKYILLRLNLHIKGCYLKNIRMACWPSKCSACFLGCSWMLSWEGRASAGYLNPGLHSHPAALTYSGTAQGGFWNTHLWIFLTCLTQSSNAEQGPVREMQWMHLAVL